jgi:hypothetical protein
MEYLSKRTRNLFALKLDTTLTLTLTRYLYILDEVILAFSISLNGIKNDITHKKLNGYEYYEASASTKSKRTFKEVCYWLSEIYYSGYEDLCWELIFMNYYDFYACNYPKLQQRLERYHKTWLKKKTFVSVLHAVKNMHIKPPDARVFNLRMQLNALCSKVNKVGDDGNGNSDTTNMNGIWFDLYIKKNKRSGHKPINKYRNFMKSIKKRNNDNVIYYFAKYDDLTLEKLLDGEMESILSSGVYSDKKHILLAKYVCERLKVVMVNSNSKSKKTKNISVLSTSAEQKYVGELNDDETIKHVPHYRVLKHKVAFGIPDVACIFRRWRDKIDELHDLRSRVLSEWEEFAYNCPLWRSRFDTYKGKIINENSMPKLVFMTEDLEEAFYKKYGYEPDEQSRDIQNMLYGI